CTMVWFSLVNLGMTEMPIFEAEMIEIEMEEEKSQELLLDQDLLTEDGDDYLHPQLLTPYNLYHDNISLPVANNSGLSDSPRIILPPPEKC
ncbi:MAG: hypothetical protein AAGH79_13175, partial [Bacteroidota bacterium]